MKYEIDQSPVGPRSTEHDRTGAMFLKSGPSESLILRSKHPGRPNAKETQQGLSDVEHPGWHGIEWDKAETGRNSINS